MGLICWLGIAASPNLGILILDSFYRLAPFTCKIEAKCTRSSHCIHQQSFRKPEPESDSCCYCSVTVLSSDWSLFSYVLFWLLTAALYSWTPILWYIVLAVPDLDHIPCSAFWWLSLWFCSPSVQFLTFSVSESSQINNLQYCWCIF